MKNILYFTISLIIISFLYADQKRDMMLPDMLIKLIDGEQTRLSSLLEDGPLLVEFWATWCAPCIKELPALDRLEQTLGGPDFVVIALNLDRGGLLEVNPFWTQTGLSNLDIYLDPTMSAGQTLSARGLPTTLLVDRNGLEIARLEGPAEWDSTEAISYFRTLIATH